MFHAIINPISGAGADADAASRRVAAVETAARERGVAVRIDLTEWQGHARELAAAAAAAGTSGLIVWGGDGTFNEAAAACVGRPIPVGLVPAGSGNGLARALGMPWDPPRALAIAFDGTPRPIDAGRIGGRLFFNVAGIGFDARVAALFNQRAAGTRGGWPYILIGIREGCRYCASEYRVTLDGSSRTHRALLMAFANGREYGLGARIAPDARLDDGWLDVLIAEDRGILARFWSVRHLVRGTPQRAAQVTTCRIKHAIVEADGDIELHVDGEPGMAKQRVEVDILPGALLIRTQEAARV